MLVAYLEQALLPMAQNTQMVKLPFAGIRNLVA